MTTFANLLAAKPATPPKPKTSAAGSRFAHLATASRLRPPTPLTTVPDPRQERAAAVAFVLSAGRNAVPHAR